MPILEVDLAEFSSPKEAMDYIIVRIEEAEADTPQGKKDLLRVNLEPKDRKKNDNHIYTEGLWTSSTVTPTSKLGAFLYAFKEYFDSEESEELEGQWGEKPNYKNPEHWEGAIFRTLSWEQKNNKIKIIGYADPEKTQKLQQELAERTSQREETQ